MIWAWICVSVLADPNLVLIEQMPNRFANGIFWVLFFSYFHIQISVIQGKQTFLQLLLCDFHRIVVRWQLCLDKGLNDSSIDAVLAVL